MYFHIEMGVHLLDVETKQEETKYLAQTWRDKETLFNPM